MQLWHPIHLGHVQRFIFNHEWTRINTNKEQASCDVCAAASRSLGSPISEVFPGVWSTQRALPIRVHLCPYVVSNFTDTDANGSENRSAVTKSRSVRVCRKAMMAAFSPAVRCRLIRPAAAAARLSASTISGLRVLLFLIPLS